MNLKENLYETLFSYILTLEELVNLENKGKNTFKKLFGKEAIDLIQDVSAAVVPEDDDNDDYTDEQYHKIIVELQGIAKRIESKREDLEHQKYLAEFEEKIALWSPEKKQAWETYKARIK